MKFNSTMGVEFTYLTKTKEFEAHRVRGYKYLVAADLKERKLPFWRVDIDEGALEISSPAFSSLEQAKNYYVGMSGVVGQYPLVTHRKDTFSGGGHIHIGIPNRYLKDPLTLMLFLINVFRDVTNRPYLGWIFNEFCNDTSANSYVHFKPGDPKAPLFDLIFSDDPQVPLLWTVKDVLNAFGHTKGFACRVDDRNGLFDSVEVNKVPTLEFRFFDAMCDWNTVEKHLLFANAYFKYLDDISQRCKEIECHVRTKKDILFYARGDRGVKEFANLVQTLGLKPVDYEPFVLKNYAMRQKARLLK